MFVMKSNVQGHKWTTKETDILMNNLMDMALGNLGGNGKPNGGDGGSVASGANGNKPSHSIIIDYELSQIILVTTSNWDSNLLGLRNWYDVYDGLV